MNINVSAGQSNRILSEVKEWQQTFQQKKSNFISVSIQTAMQILDAYYMMKKIQDSNVDQEFLTPNSPLNLVDDDFVGDSNHLDRQRFIDGLTRGLLPVIIAIEASIAGNANDARENLRKLLRT